MGPFCFIASCQHATIVCTSLVAIECTDSNVLVSQSMSVVVLLSVVDCCHSVSCPQAPESARKSPVLLEYGVGVMVWCEGVGVCMGV